MEITKERYHIIGILCYLNYPKYLKIIDIKCVADIFDKMEEEIEDLSLQIEEFEKYYKLIKDKNDRDGFLCKINNKKEELVKMQNQFNFIKK
jgi:hypothetical protein